MASQQQIAPCQEPQPAPPGPGGQILPHRRERAPGCHAAAFTLIEILVVVGIIALLLAILLPSLAKAREQSRRAVCASNLKQFTHGTAMYSLEYKDSLPGPLHCALELETFEKIASLDYEEWHLPYMTRKYFTDHSTGGKSTDEVAICPTAIGLSRTMLENTYGTTDWRRPFSYALNNWNRSRNEFGTDPPWYFGYPDYYWQNTQPPFRRLPSPDRDALPKKTITIKEPGREWAIADAFRYPNLQPIPAGSTRQAGDWQRGTYLFSFVTTEKLIPQKPYHDDGINLAMFDGHVEYQRPWRGSVNPR